MLTYCVKIQNVAAVEVLLRHGADPNTTSRKGVAPISGAAHKGNVAIIKMLIDSGAAVNSTNSTGSTALIQVTIESVLQSNPYFPLTSSVLLNRLLILDICQPFNFF